MFRILLGRKTTWLLAFSFVSPMVRDFPAWPSKRDERDRTVDHGERFLRANERGHALLVTPPFCAVVRDNFLGQWAVFSLRPDEFEQVEEEERLGAVLLLRR